MKEEIILTNENVEISTENIENMYTNTLTGKTKSSYMNTIKTFFKVDSLEDIKISDMQSVTVDTAIQYAHELLDKGIKKSTINQRLSAMQNFYKFLCRRNVGIMNYNPFSTDEGCIRFKNAQKNYSDKRTLTKDEVRRLFDTAKKAKGVTGKRDLLVLELLCTTGMRRAEVANLRIGDIVYTSGSYFLSVIGKGDKARMAKLSTSVQEILKEYLDMRKLTLANKRMPLIANHSSNADCTKCVSTETIYNIVKKYANLTGIGADNITPHCCRHTFATTAFNELGTGKDHIQELLGHASSSTTQRYIKSAQMFKSTVSNELDTMYN